VEYLLLFCPESTVLLSLLYSRLLSINLKIKIYRTIILLLVSYGCKTLTLREEPGLRVFEKIALSRIFVSKREKVAGDWRKLRSEELHNLYTSPDNTRVIRVQEHEMGVACCTHGGYEKLMHNFGWKI
jgi:hypothetical protein